MFLHLQLLSNCKNDSYADHLIVMQKFILFLFKANLKKTKKVISSVNKLFNTLSFCIYISLSPFLLVAIFLCYHFKVLSASLQAFLYWFFLVHLHLMDCFRVNDQFRVDYLGNCFQFNVPGYVLCYGLYFRWIPLFLPPAFVLILKTNIDIIYYVDELQQISNRHTLLLLFTLWLVLYSIQFHL